MSRLMRSTRAVPGPVSSDSRTTKGMPPLSTMYTVRFAVKDVAFGFAARTHRWTPDLVAVTTYMLPSLPCIFLPMGRVAALWEGDGRTRRAVVAM